jgi:hypothetical protein
MRVLRCVFLAGLASGLVACGGSGEAKVDIVASSSSIVQSSEQSSVVVQLGSSSEAHSSQAEVSSMPVVHSSSAAPSSIAHPSSVAVLSSSVSSSSVLIVLPSSSVASVPTSVSSISSSVMTASSSLVSSSVQSSSVMASLSSVSSSVFHSSSLMASSSAISSSVASSVSSVSSSVMAASSSLVSSSVQSSSVVSSLSSSSSSSSSLACMAGDTDCDGVSDTLDTAFNCRGDDTSEGGNSPFRQLTLADGTIINQSSGLAETLNPLNVLSPGDAEFGTLSIVLTGSAGVSITLTGQQEGSATSPGKVAFVLSDESPLLAVELLWGTDVSFDGVASAAQPALLVSRVEGGGGYDKMFVISVDTPTNGWQTVSFRQGAVLGVAPTPKLHKVCVEDQL